MEINGYGYKDFIVSKSDLQMPSFQINVDEGEFILNLADGKK